MSLTASEMTPADIAAVNGNGFNNGFGGDGAWWLIVLFLFAFAGRGFGFGNDGGGAMPYFNETQRGFDQASTMSGINALQASVNNGFANAEVASCNRALDAMQTAYTNQIADLQQQFASQTVQTSNFNNLQSQLADCCCENRLATADLRYTIATEACADRAAVNDGVRDIIANQTAGIQTILDKLCQQEIDALKTQNANLQTQVNMQALAASQANQTAALVADNNAQTQALINRIAPYPTPSYVVSNPNLGINNCGCGCGSTF